MLLFNTGTPESGAGKSVTEQLVELRKAIKENIASFTEPLKAYQNIEKTAISMADNAKSLQRSMGGVAIDSEKYANSLIESYKNTVKIGAEFKDITGTIQGLAESMGRMVRPSEQTIQNMVELSVATGMGAGEIGKMTGEITRFGGSQVQATDKMHDLAVEARKVGLDAKSFLTQVNANMKSLNGFGFKNGINGMKNMVKQAMLLRTSVEKIGAAALQSKVLDPEGAMEVAASFQMLGGAVGALGDPFKLLHMAQSDMAGLQNEIINSTKSAFKFNKETGGFEASTQDMYRLREQATLMGKSLEDMMELGREGAKMDFLKEKFNIGELPDETQQLVAGLAEIGKDGKVSIDIPGFGRLEADSAEQLSVQLKNGETQKALQDYQTKAAQTEKDIAISQLTITETQAKDVNIIKSAMLTQMGEQSREQLLKDIKEGNEAASNKLVDASETSAKNINTAVSGAATAQKNLINSIPTPVDQQAEQEMRDVLDKLSAKFGEPTEVPTNDGFFPSNGSAPTLMSKGQLYKGIVGDDVAMGVGLGDALSKKQSGSLTGAIDININLNGSINGDTGQIAKMFNSQQVQKQIMDTVLYKLKDYKNQQGVLS